MSFFNCKSFLVDVYNEHCGRSAIHVTDTAKLLNELVLFALKKKEFLLGQTAGTYVIEVHLFEFLHTYNTLRHGLEVGEHTAQPTLRHVWHVHASSLSRYCLCSLLLGTYEPNGAVVCYGLLDEVISLIDQIERLEQVDDVNAVALSQDELLHLRVPTTSLMAKMNASLEHLAHGNFCHDIPFCRFLPGYADSHTAV